MRNTCREFVQAFRADRPFLSFSIIVALNPFGGGAMGATMASVFFIKYAAERFTMNGELGSFVGYATVAVTVSQAIVGPFACRLIDR